VPGVKDHNSRKYGKKSLDNMFLDDWSRVLVMDDREDVWMTGTQHRHLLLVRGGTALLLHCTALHCTILSFSFSVHLLQSPTYEACCVCI
jgi:hypothetical protein